MDPIHIVLAFMASSFGTIAFGCVLLARGWNGFRSGVFPLTRDTDLEGFAGRAAASLMIALGALVAACGVATLVFCCYRLTQLA